MSSPGLPYGLDLGQSGLHTGLQISGSGLHITSGTTLSLVSLAASCGLTVALCKMGAPLDHREAAQTGLVAAAPSSASLDKREPVGTGQSESRAGLGSWACQTEERPPRGPSQDEQGLGYHVP